MTEKHGSPNGFPPAHQERLEQGREAGNPFFKKDSPSSSSSSKNTLIVGVGTLISRLLGFVRDAGIAWLLGGSGAADALTAALRIPYMARRLFGEGTLSLSLTAACTRERLRGGSGCGLALAVTRKLALWTGFLALACMAGAGIIMRAIAPGLEERPEVFGEAVTLFRICAPYIWSVMMAAGCMAALHSRQRFLLPSLTPSLFNLCVIGFALLAAFNPSLQPGVLVACGVLCGGILQWLAQVPAIRILQREEGKRGKPADARTVSEAFRRLPAGIVGAAMPQLAFLGASALASLLPEGHMASLFYAERLLEFPLGVLGAAVGMAAAPRLAELAASKGLSRSSRFHEIPSFSLSQPQKPEQADPPPPLSASRTARNDTKAIPGARLQKPWDGEGMAFEDGEPFFKRGEPPHGSLSPPPSSLPTAPPHSFSDEIQRAALLSLGLNLPAAAGLAAISLPLVAVVLGHGAFDAQAVSATALALCAYAPGLPAYALSRPLLAACHALESGLPLKATAVALAVALAGGYALTLRFGAWGPPLGVSLGLWCNAALLWIGLSRRVSLRLALRSLAVQLAGTALTFGSAYGVVLWAGHASNIAQLALAIPAGAAVYAASLLIGDRNWFRLLKKR